MRLQYNSLSDDPNFNLDKLFQRQNCFIEVNPGKVILPKKYNEIGESILDLQVRKDDIFLISYPRTGSTWAQEMVWLLGNNMDYAGAARMQALRAPLLELSAIFSEDHTEWLNKSIGNSVSCVDSLPSPRFIKTHLPWQLLPNQLDTVKPKIIYIARNPKDLCVSYYYYCTLIHGLNGTFDEFCECFLANRTPIGSVWEHVMEFWKRRNEPNILFLKYEDMKLDLPGTIWKCAEFMGVAHKMTQENVSQMAGHLIFEKMQNNPAVNLDPILNADQPADKNENRKIKFIRNGKIGDWRNYMDSYMSEKFDKWIEEHTRGTGLDFIYE
ncbi:luciferin sulfotransferase-like [Lutzomyia longipalpis]|uniref:luciferin sulfotransferase-like n=1 Tax=Lutzomyia longipalpis TaxID=7200 RepID=UPI0024841E6B|nr:luciferin sulfotransferase-like [Lutzomyia longipalpis]